MPQRIDHKKFLTVGETAKLLGTDAKGHYLLAGHEYTTLLEHYEWFREFIANKRRAALANPHPGRKARPASEIQPQSLARRERRRRGGR